MRDVRTVATRARARIAVRRCAHCGVACAALVAASRSRCRAAPASAACRARGESAERAAAGEKGGQLAGSGGGEGRATPGARWR